jgi:hypothetical protein
MTTDRIWPREMGSNDPRGASEKIARTERPALRRSADGGVPLGRWATRYFAREAAAFLGQSMLFAGSVGCMLAVVGVLLKLF